ncbi:MAG: FadR family transcriptional regulator [Clostridiales bacterium]|nr:FadR family transcriptional regulator [Clostridiales bacterium]
MKLGEIVAPTIKELFIQRLEELILSGELRPGNPLPTEREIADEMKISKTTVHEGLRELIRLGFLETEGRKGVRVADYAQTGNLDTLLAIMRYRDGRLDSTTLRSMLDARGYLEYPAFEALAESHTPEDVARLTTLAEEAAHAAEISDDALAEALFRYHRTVTFLSGNTITPLILNAFLPACINSWKTHIRRVGREHCVRRLEEFTRCIEAGDGSGAVRLLREDHDGFIQELDSGVSRAEAARKRR